MHELALCERIVEAALEAYAAIDPPPQRLKSVTVVAGGTYRIAPDHMAFVYEVLTRDTPLAGSAMHMRTDPVLAACGRCGWEGEIEWPLFVCGSCAAAGVTVVRGAELYLERLEVEEG